jgi:hypothetical protein
MKILSLIIGLETECLYQLMTFGVPVYTVPWVCGSDNNHKRWIEDHYERETGSESCLQLE